MSIRDSGGPWLFGKDITLADVSVMPAIVRMADLGRDGDWADLPRVAKWYELIRAQPAFKPTYYPGSLLTERFPHLRKGSRALGRGLIRADLSIIRRPRCIRAWPFRASSAWRRHQRSGLPCAKFSFCSQ